MFEKLKNLFQEESDEVQEDSTVFVGTTKELLDAVKAQAVQDTPVEETPQEETCHMSGKYDDKVWLNLEFLKMALEIEKSKNQRLIFYIDVGNLPKQKAEQYVRDIMDNYKNPDNKPGDFFLPRREGGRGTELNSVSSRITLEAVLETAKTLKNFATE